jgi:hypothetical protein
VTACCYIFIKPFALLSNSADKNYNMYFTDVISGEHNRPCDKEITDVIAQLVYSEKRCYQQQEEEERNLFVQRAREGNYPEARRGGLFFAGMIHPILTSSARWAGMMSARAGSVGCPACCASRPVQAIMTPLSPA